MLSAVSQQVQTIQEALKGEAEAKTNATTISVELVGKQVRGYVHLSPPLSVFSLCLFSVSSFSLNTENVDRWYYLL